jgi:hypothetical protein
MSHPISAQAIIEHIAFADLCSWAIVQPSFQLQFKEQTGHDLAALATASPIENMIDESTGRTKATMAAWIEWVRENLWGTTETIPASTDLPPHSQP